ncbi:GNAT family N-acetyltransferase [Roseomonas hellenica]|uniref:GNAT family N-acetyltransferase n=1 Tax=Plastoroseomonas hellenica TaxID=2687306 RepID=A0ABS5F929_9PROT|nr:GNAT family N-acetyltransferase [Plastoroseomonas hellenica]MBR0669067.1 GNAT family N-acetyltransferase [Plastoroseomonas hellenica]
MIRCLGAADAAAYRAIRLEALERCPENFGASADIEGAQPLAWFAERLAGSHVFAAGGDPLDGVIGLRPQEAPKLRHKVLIWGFYVRPAARRRGLGAALLGHAIAAARGLVEELRLSVAAENAAAIRLYEAAGFTAYGREPRALRVGGRDVDELLMALRLDQLS